MKMARTRIATWKSVGPPWGQSSSTLTAPVQGTREVHQKDAHDKGKGPTANESENEERPSQSKSGSESDYETETQIQEGLDEEMTEPEEHQVNLRTISADDYAILRHSNQYLYPSDSINPRFHTKFQEWVYEQLYEPNRKFADHKWIKWQHINSLDKYNGVYRLFSKNRFSWSRSSQKQLWWGDCETVLCHRACLSIFFQAAMDDSNKLCGKQQDRFWACPENTI